MPAFSGELFNIKEYNKEIFLVKLLIDFSWTTGWMRRPPMLLSRPWFLTQQGRKILHSFEVLLINNKSHVLSCFLFTKIDLDSELKGYEKVRLSCFSIHILATFINLSVWIYKSLQVGKGIWVSLHTCGVKEQFVGSLSTATMWVSQIGLGSLGLTESTFTHWIISMNTSPTFFYAYYLSKCTDCIRFYLPYWV